MGGEPTRIHARPESLSIAPGTGFSGTGLVRTVDNFGTTGELPSHPELLDDLAVGFMDDSWSIKQLVREIVLSRTYRLASIDDEEGRAADPENRLFWRANRRRLDAEYSARHHPRRQRPASPRSRGTNFSGRSPGRLRIS